MNNVLAASVADMDFEVAPEIMSALQERLRHQIFGYEAFPNSLLNSVIKWYHDRHHWFISSSHILRSPNMLNALAVALIAYTQPDDKIMIQPPVFHDFYDVIAENNRNIILNPLVLVNNRYEIDFDDLEKKASDPKTTMLFLCNPHNPTGTVWEKSELTRLGEICYKHKVLVVSDEMHGDIVFGKHIYTPFASINIINAMNSITLISPAKTFNIASLCSSFTIIPNEHFRNTFKVENSKLTVNKNNALSNVAMEAAYQYGQSWLASVIDYLEENLNQINLILEQIPQIDIIQPQGTFLAWLDFRKLKLNQSELMAFLKQVGLILSSGEKYGKNGVGFARLNFACNRDHLITALYKLKQQLQ